MLLLLPGLASVALTKHVLHLHVNVLSITHLILGVLAIPRNCIAVPLTSIVSIIVYGGHAYFTHPSIYIFFSTVHITGGSIAILMAKFVPERL